MGRRLVSTKDMSREDWLELRKHSIGGSDAGAIMGMNDWRSPLEVYADKLGLIPEKETNESMRLGNDLEDYVARRFVEATGKKVRKANFMYMHDKYDFITANVDREVVGENAGLECKTMSQLSKYDVENGEIPAQYYCQCQHYMEVMGYDHMYIGFLVYSKGFFWHKVDRNQDFIDQMIALELEFWHEFVEKQVPPDPDGSESSMDTLMAMYPKDNGTEVWLDNDHEVMRYQELTRTIKRLKNQKDEMKAAICSELGNSSTGSSDRFIVTWKTQCKTGVDNKLLQAKYPDIYDECKTVTESRVMRVKERKEK